MSSIKNTIGYLFTTEERKSLREIAKIFFLKNKEGFINPKEAIDWIGRASQQGIGSEIQRFLLPFIHAENVKRSKPL